MPVFPYKAMSACGRSHRLLLLSICFCASLLWYTLSTVGDRHNISTGNEGGEKTTRTLTGTTKVKQGMDSHHAVIPNDHVRMNDPVDKALDHKMITKLTNLVKHMDTKQKMNPLPPETKIMTHLKGPEADSDLDVVEASSRKAQRMRSASGLKSLVPDFKVVKSGSEVKVDKEKVHDKWIVVTSVVLPTADVKFLANLTDWKVVVVGDVKTPEDWSYSNCEFLSVKAQAELGFRVTSRLPYKSYARKNVGYLYAIAHGAKVIYETDDDNRPLDHLMSFRLKDRTSGLLFSGRNLFNPYRHFGQSTLWPRGYPLGAIGEDTEIAYRLNWNWPSPAIQQGVVNGDPDMDAVFRLTRKKTLTPLDVKFDPAAPFVILPEGVFSPFNSQNTLFRYDALWAMLLPTTTTFRMCDIWRGYWAQRLLWEINGRLAFFPANAYQQRNAHSYMADAEDEKDMYFETDRLLNFLTSWTCPVELSFFQCVYQLSLDMAKRGFWEQGDVELTKLWLEDLARVGYKEPTRAGVTENVTKRRETTKDKLSSENKTEVQNEGTAEETSVLERKWATAVKQGSHAYFYPAEQAPPTIGVNSTSHHSDVIKQTEVVTAFCPSFSALTVQRDAMKRTVNPFFHDILLIVVYNWPYYGNVKYNEAKYRILFPNIIYCGDNVTKFTEETASLGRNLSFIEAPVAGGLMGYQCTIRAMQMSYNVRGYLVVGEDVILNTWNFENFDKSRVWMSMDIFVFNATSGTNWMWWKLPGGEKSYKAAMAGLRRKPATPDEVTETEKFLSTLKVNSGADANCIHALNDVYYIPREMTTNVIFYMSYFARYKLMVEMAVPLTLCGLKPKHEIQLFKGVSLWLEQRTDPWPRFSTENHFLHPVKFSNETNHQFFCTFYLASLINLGFSPRQQPQGHMLGMQ